MPLSGTLLNMATVLLGTAVGLAAGRRLPPRMQDSLTTGLGFFTLVVAVAMAIRVFTDTTFQPGDELAVLAALLVGVVIGEVLRIHDGLEGIGAWFQRRLAADTSGSRVAEGFVTASLVFCVGPLTILGSIENGLTGDIQLLAIKSLLDMVAAAAFAAALGWGVGLGHHHPRRPGRSCPGSGISVAHDRPGRHRCDFGHRRLDPAGRRPAPARSQAGPGGELPAGARAGTPVRFLRRRHPRLARLTT